VALPAAVLACVDLESVTAALERRAAVSRDVVPVQEIESVLAAADRSRPGAYGLAAHGGDHTMAAPAVSSPVGRSHLRRHLGASRAGRRLIVLQAQEFSVALGVVVVQCGVGGEDDLLLRPEVAGVRGETRPIWSLTLTSPPLARSLELRQIARPSSDLLS